MDSMQLRRENKTDEREIHVEKDKVPKITTHFESLTVKDSGDHPATHHVAAGGIHDQGQYQGPSLEDITKYRRIAQQNSMEAVTAAQEQYRKSKQTVAAEKATKVKDYTVEKDQEAKDVVAGKTSGLTETVVDVSKKGASYVGEKAVAAKEVAVETGKTTVGYVGKVAEVVKDKAVVAGWSAAEFASDKAVGATETVANVSSAVAGLAGDTIVATKDVVGVGKKTKDVVVATEESAKDYAARKKAEKQRELEAKNSKDEGEWAGKEHEVGFEHQAGGGFVEEGDFEPQGAAGGGGGAAGGGVMRVIGETLVEIGRNTKDMVVGQGGYEGEQKLVGESRKKF
ncbi:hypothetical protein L1987_63314 [Smallanthus sonchifolius]|uniref:Uncharacterized protein n=1 Tax=Smallanthus sonchifolius TaxID=185202 RepID=A0ACB9CD90_9ASTR|nr:hypothetical protein L1987_63314 [Smallanthus sonchifolius]